MKMQLWSVDTGDWQLPGTQVIVLRVMAALHNGMVVLFHDGAATPGVKQWPRWPF